MTFRYYDDNKKKIEDISLIKKVLSIGSKDNPIIVDSKYLPIIEAAEKGDWLAKAETVEIFYKGEGVEKNYEIANYFIEQILDEINMDEYRAETIVEVKRNNAFLEKAFGHYNEAIKWYLDAILFQQENVVVENWDFQLYAELERLLKIVKD